ncbi:MAG TPA: HAD-IA family hydrolase [Caldimonas sp.]|nr:HAD-IA family hydrolase [Caldimonas sp.]
MTGRFTLVSFDLDGTLVDTVTEIAEAVNRTLAELGLPRQAGDAVQRRIGAGTRELLLTLLRDLGREQGAVEGLDRDDALRRFDVHYAATAGTCCLPYPHVADALDRLRRGGVRLACVTNKEMRFTTPVLGACGLDRAFDLIVGGDSLTVKKPDGDVLRHVMRVLRARAEATAHVGDSRIDVEAARNAGVAAWAVPYGYNGGDPIEASAPDRLFAHAGEVADTVLGRTALGRPAPG